ncbi:MAG: polysaccharide export protein [Desulfohalobiaceae bacterium]|nr:polysaccharide export protein [Desulfohalobiaceae bacterium]
MTSHQSNARLVAHVILFCLLTLFYACAAQGPTTVVSSAGSGLEELPAEEQARVEKIIENREGTATASALPEGFEQAQSIPARDYVKSRHISRETGPEEYLVGPEDVLKIDVFEEKDLSREAVKVTSEGLIHFPLIGRVKVAGLNSSEIEDLLAARLAHEQYLVDPHLSVSVREYLSKEVLVLGAVQSPGRYYLKGVETLLDLVSRAGGVDFSKGGHRVTIIREEAVSQDQGRKIAVNINLRRLLDGFDQYANLKLQAGDVIFVPKAEKIYVMGQVQQPGDYVLTDKRITLVEAISMAGGFTRIAAPNRTKIIRVQNGQKTVIQVRVDDLTQDKATAQSLTLKPNDIIIVPESFF